CAVGVLPGEAVLFTRRGDDALGVLVHVVAVAFLEGILVLCLDVTVGDRNGITFIRTDAAIEQLLPASRSVERPLLSTLHDRNRKWPVLVADQHERAAAVLRVDRHGVLLTRQRDKLSGA